MDARVETMVNIWREGDEYVAHAMPVNVMSSGPTPDEARAAVAEALHLFLLTARDCGTLEQILEEAGYHHHDLTWVAPEWVATERRAVAI